jgi:hypothetical protein
MSNHAHFLLRSGSGGIAHLMRRLLTGYAVSFNHRHRRHGQLFQNHYKSIICQEDVYLKELEGIYHGFCQNSGRNFRKISTERRQSWK